MIDLWIAEETTTPKPIPERRDEPRFGEIVRQVLKRELVRRRGLSAYGQLGVRNDSDWVTIDAAYEGCRARYLPESYRRYGHETMALASEVLGLLDKAHDHLKQSAATPIQKKRLRFITRLWERLWRTMGKRQSG
jgi:hypothetical protein